MMQVMVLIRTVFSARVERVIKVESVEASDTGHVDGAVMYFLPLFLYFFLFFYHSPRSGSIRLMKSGKRNPQSLWSVF